LNVVVSGKSTQKPTLYKLYNHVLCQVFYASFCHIFCLIRSLLMRRSVIFLIFYLKTGVILAESKVLFIFYHYDETNSK